MAATPTLPRRSDRSRTRRPRIRKIKVHAVNIDVFDGVDAWVITAWPHVPEIHPLRAQLPKCVCDTNKIQRKVRPSGQCRWCLGWDILGMASYTLKLLRSYPKQTVEVPAAGVSA